MARSALGWHRQDILAEIRKRGTSLSRLARENGLASSTLHQALGRRYPRANTLIAGFLGRSRHELWPDWFDANDRPVPLSHYARRQRGARD